MIPSEASASAIAPPHDEQSLSQGNSAILITPEPVPAASKPKRTGAADAQAPSTNLEAAPATTASSSHPSNTNMTMSQDYDAPALPERSSLPVHEATHTVNLAPDTNLNHPEDPQLASLQAIFPDFDGVVLQSVLESVEGNQDHAIDMLLGMSDPDYVSQEQPAPVQSRTDRDEEFARRLMLEEQQQARQEQAQQHQHWGSQGHPQYDSPNQPRVHGRYSQPPQDNDNNPIGQKDSMAEIQEQFSKIADTGKKTFNTLFTKVKAKMQEFDQQRAGQSYTQGGTQPSWGSAPPSEQSQLHYQSQQQQAQPSYYDPNPPPQGLRPVQGYDATALRTIAPSEFAVSSMTPPVSTTNPPVRNSSPPTSMTVAETPRPPSTGSGPPHIDPGKLGMLPKRPVSLLRNPAEPAPKPDEDEDELEYVENPFERQ
jgi:hypothetical protein